ncbi:cell division protein PerM [Wenjunlia tyrosinilytica]|uniref:Integral membrane protein n=1 Tax=Wenjunlia tyrosinilytica TaxID=1544741 RepID=A0A918DU58_9ACTN|nr:hypothetical protein GCM10012280_12290 [Wenjunlia tyrosinilytica]
MSQLIGRSPVLPQQAPPRPGPAGRRLPAITAALFGGALAAGLGLGVFAVVVLFLWITSPYSDSGPSGALHIAADLWLLAHGGDLLRMDTRSGVPAPVGVTPLLLAVLPLWLLNRSGANAVESPETEAPEKERPGTDGPEEDGPEEERPETDSVGTDSVGMDSGGADGTGTDSTGADGAGVDGGGVDGGGVDGVGTDSVGTHGGGTDGGGTGSMRTHAGGTDGVGTHGGGTDSVGTHGGGTDSVGTHGGGTDGGGTDSVGTDGDRAPAPRPISGVATILLMCCGYCLVALAALFYTSSGPIRSRPSAALALIPLLALLAAGSGAWTALGRPRWSPPATLSRAMGKIPLRPRELLPWENAVLALRATAVGALTLVGGGAVITAAALIWHTPMANGSFETLTDAPSGRLAVLLLSAALLPNAAVWSASYALGPGFAVGAGTAVGAAGAHYAGVPNFPLLAALPGRGNEDAGEWLAFAVPLAAAVAVAVVVVKATRDLRETAVVTALASVGVGLVMVLATLLASGPMGTNRLSDFGPAWWSTGVAALAWTACLAIPAALTTRCYHLRTTPPSPRSVLPSLHSFLSRTSLPKVPSLPKAAALPAAPRKTLTESAQGHERTESSAPTPPSESAPPSEGRQSGGESAPPSGSALPRAGTLPVGEKSPRKSGLPRAGTPPGENAPPSGSVLPHVGTMAGGENAPLSEGALPREGAQAGGEKSPLGKSGLPRAGAPPGENAPPSGSVLPHVGTLAGGEKSPLSEGALPREGAQAGGERAERQSGGESAPPSGSVLPRAGTPAGGEAPLGRTVPSGEKAPSLPGAAAQPEGPSEPEPPRCAGAPLPGGAASVRAAAAWRTRPFGVQPLAVQPLAVHPLGVQPSALPTADGPAESTTPLAADAAAQGSATSAGWARSLLSSLRRRRDGARTAEARREERWGELRAASGGLMASFSPVPEDPPTQRPDVSS